MADFDVGGMGAPRLSSFLTLRRIFHASTGGEEHDCRGNESNLGLLSLTRTLLWTLMAKVMASDPVLRLG